MLEWRGNSLWYGVYLLADVLSTQGAVRLDLQGWDGWGLCDYRYPNLREAKAAAEAWARCRGMALADEREDRYGNPSSVCDDDIPF